MLLVIILEAKQLQMREKNTLINTHSNNIYAKKNNFEKKITKFK